MGVYFVYEASPYGLLWVVETLPDIPGDQERLTAYENRVAANGTEGLRSIAEVVVIRGGTPALVGTGSNGVATVEFVEGGVQFSILGPKLARDDAVAIAESIENPL
jgi:hypothetical protein